MSPVTIARQDIKDQVTVLAPLRADGKDPVPVFGLWHTVVPTISPSLNSSGESLACAVSEAETESFSLGWEGCLPAFLLS